MDGKLTHRYLSFLSAPCNSLERASPVQSIPMMSCNVSRSHQRKQSYRSPSQQQSSVEALPSDVWSLLLSYAYDSNVWCAKDEPLSFRPGPPPGFWLLCRSLTEGLHLWIWSALSDEVKRTSGVLRLPGGSLIPGVSLSRWTSYTQKRIISALISAPSLFLSSIRSIQGAVVGLEETLHQLHLDHLDSISGPFLRRSQDFRWLYRVDLRHLSSLKELGTSFLSFCNVEEMFLPESVERIGDGFLTGSRIRVLDLSGTRITHVGDEFLKGAPLTSIKFPPSLRHVGHEFLSGCPNPAGRAFDPHAQGIIPLAVPDLQLDLSTTQLESVGNHFLADSSVIGIQFPRSLKTVGTHFLFKYSGERLDLSTTSLESVGDAFLSHSKVLELYLPASLKEVGPFFLENFQGRRLDLSRAALKNLSFGFLSESSIEELLLPPAVKSATPDFLRNHRGRVLNLHRTFLTDVGDPFLPVSHMEVLIFPRSLRVVPNFFLHQHQTKRLDLSQCGFERVGNWFLAYSAVEVLLLPPTLSVVGDLFLCGFRGRRLDLSRTRLQFIGEGFLSGSQTEELLLPAAMRMKGVTNFILESCPSVRFV